MAPRKASAAKSAAASTPASKSTASTTKPRRARAAKTTAAAAEPVVPVAEPEPELEAANESVGEDEFQVEKILDCRKQRDGTNEYFIKWLSYPNSSNTWEPEKHISPEIIKEFMASQEQEAASEAPPAPHKTTRAGNPRAPMPTKRAPPKKTSALGSRAKRKETVQESPAKRAKEQQLQPEALMDQEEEEEEEEKEPILSDHSSMDQDENQPDNKQADEPPMVFHKFKPARIIDQSQDAKVLVFQGKYNGQEAVVRLEKTTFEETATKKALTDKELLSSREFVNDIYSTYLITPSEAQKTVNSIKAVVICPADKKVLAKYTRAKTIFFSETPDVYSKVVEPFIEAQLKAKENPHKWIYNILESKSEVDRVIYNDTDPNSGFMLVPNLKASESEDEVNVLAICHRRDIRSLRDLTDKHITLLRNILTKGTQALQDKYKKSAGEIRAYIHYQPSFYHFHVHFRIVDPSAYQSTDRDHLLATVINNLTLHKPYYKKSTLIYPLAENHPLFIELHEAGRI